jgi:hypothetical protein
LFCSHQTCRNGGVKFRFCTVCQVPVAKRNFRQRHMHGMLNKKNKRTLSSKQEEQMKPSSSAAQNQVQQHPLSAAEQSAAARAATLEAHTIDSGSCVSPMSPLSPMVAKTETAPYNDTPSQEPQQRGQQQKQVDKPPCDFAKTTNDADMNNTQADLSSNSDAGCSSLSSDGDGGMMEGNGGGNQQQIKSNKSKTVDAKDTKNCSSNQSHSSHLEAPAATQQQMQVVNAWLSLLWERPAADDEEGMSLWMERVRGASRMKGPVPSSSGQSSPVPQEHTRAHLLQKNQHETKKKLMSSKAGDTRVSSSSDVLT